MLQNTNYAQMLQDISSIALRNPVASKIFASALLPVHATQTSLPKDVSNNDNNFTDNGDNWILLNTISDFSTHGGV